MVDTDGLWANASADTLLFLPSFDEPSGTLLLYLLAYTHPLEPRPDGLVRRYMPDKMLAAYHRLIEGHQ